MAFARKDLEKSVRRLPETPGVYFMHDEGGRILYIGKAINLRRRVSSYFMRPQNERLASLVQEVMKIKVLKTDTALEALFFEAQLIKKHWPFYNIRDKDDSGFLYVEVTNEEFPRVLLMRDNKEENGFRYGPFISASNIRQALKVLRRIFPYQTHAAEEVGRLKPCFESQIGLCPGTCAGLIDRRAYLRIVRNMKLFLNGQKEKVVADMRREMLLASKKLQYEEAASIKRRLFALQHIHDAVLIMRDKKEVMNNGIRVEGYDISNISGTSAVGVMVVFVDGEPDKSEYRKFRIRTIIGSNDAAMIDEVLQRRLQHAWKLPNLILIDGGKPQLSAAVKVLAVNGLSIPVVSIAKGPKRDRNDVYGVVPKFTNIEILIRVRDEAHRFAIQYHRARRGKDVFN